VSIEAWHALLPLGAYAVGCMVGAYYLVRLRTGRDIRTVGSGNVGARNVGRMLGPSGFTLVFLIDAGKGVVATWTARRLGVPDVVVVVVMVAVVAGHIWPVQLQWRGGKGAATALGALLAYDFVVAVTLLGLGVLVLVATRSLTAGGFTALIAAPVVAAVVGHGWLPVGGLALLAALVILAHRPEPKRLTHGRLLDEEEASR
jgi:glycerol-3-phosphate acyltransferase PlsY